MARTHRTHMAPSKLVVRGGRRKARSREGWLALQEGDSPAKRAQVKPQKQIRVNERVALRREFL